MENDKVIIKDLLARGILGLNDWERTEEQDILINLTLFTTTRRAGTADNIEHCVNYRTAAKKIIEHVESAARFTAEALAEDIAGICLAMPRVSAVTVRVEKPGAVRFAASVGVEISRKRSDVA